MNKLFAWILAHSKAETAVAGVVLTVAQTEWGPGNKWVSLGVLVATALGVYRIPNRDKPPSVAVSEHPPGQRS